MGLVFWGFYLFAPIVFCINFNLNLNKAWPTAMLGLPFCGLKVKSLIGPKTFELHLFPRHCGPLRLSRAVGDSIVRTYLAWQLLPSCSSVIP